MRRTRSTQSGFTLIELMVVVVIIAIISALVIGVQSRTYGASAQSVADQAVNDANLARMRAVSTRRWHRLEVTSNQIKLWQSSVTGLTTPTTWQLVQTTNFPTGGATIWDGSTTVYYNAGVASVSQNTAVDFLIDFSPDGSSTGGTLFVTDNKGVRKWRVILYKSTGTAYDRESW
jgi:prepilin-type N-terminal cleavage/methylation domain-containing protein